jgi:hypothetical protein
MRYQFDSEKIQICSQCSFARETNFNKFNWTFTTDCRLLNKYVEWRGNDQYRPADCPLTEIDDMTASEQITAGCIAQSQAESEERK